MKESFLHNKLNQRKQESSYRQLRLATPGSVDFCSNDYLGIVRNRLLETPNDLYPAGATGSRLLSGNYALVEETEALIASFHEAATALIFNSGYDANLGLLSSVPQRGDMVLYDYLSHASIRDGIRLSFADAFSFRHNDLNDLEEKLRKAKRTVFIVTESVFSMDGDICPLQELVELAERYNAQLVIDEAHATGVIGERGEGLVQQLGLQDKVFARVHTFGKACGCHGAAVLGSAALRDYLVNFARSFIYSTALSPQAVAHIRGSYQLFPTLAAEREQLRRLVEQFRQAKAGISLLASQTPIQGVIVPGNEQARATAVFLQGEGLDVRPILYPTVPKGEERLRIVLHSFNTQMEVDRLLNSLKNSL